jgi:hypothetical protein
MHGRPGIGVSVRENLTVFSEKKALSTTRWEQYTTSSVRKFRNGRGKSQTQECSRPRQDEDSGVVIWSIQPPDHGNPSWKRARLDGYLLLVFSVGESRIDEWRL